ncbi:MAG: SusC/RagA family TonB-linked outer membrane protein [Sphingobacteriales bacterium]|nr:SusC/RagA family TonB-linked outer membrane protein [Sphingobacteriales bacterium]
MRLTAILLLTGFLQVSAAGYSQKVSISGDNLPLKTIFKTIEKQTDFVFMYNETVLDDTKAVSVHMTDVAVTELLDKCLRDQPVLYSITGKTIFIKKKQPQLKVEAPAIASPLSQIVGTVQSDDGKPLDGATILLRNTKISTVTNAKGQFFLPNVPQGTYVLEVTYIGYEKYFQSIVVEKSELIVTATMKASANNLDETVVKGYYNTTTRLNTGDVSIVKGEEIQRQPLSDPILALQGRVPGLSITQLSGTIPGASFRLLLNGQNSIANGNSPLFVVDGVIIPSQSLTLFSGGGGYSQSPFNALSPGDIESVEILKDADATAIYGSRGANGVLLITTKKGKAGKVKLDISLANGIGKDAREIKVLNTSQYLSMRREAFTNDGQIPSGNDHDINGDWDTTRYTDWQHYFFGGTARYTNGQISFSGGNENTQFLLTGGYNKQTTILPGDFADKKGNAHLSLSHLSTDKRLKLTASAMFVNDRNNSYQNANTLGYIFLPPDAPSLYDSQGNLNWQNSTWTNPLALLLRTYKSVTDNLVANASISYKLIQGLDAKISIGYNSDQMKDYIASPITSFNPATARSTNRRASFSTNSIKSSIIEPQLSYNRILGNGDLNMLIGASLQNSSQDRIQMVGINYPSDALMPNISAASTKIITGVNSLQYKYVAGFGRLNYNWKERYLINLTARRDGSSRFGSGKQFGNFGAFGTAWIFSKERFFLNKMKWISYGKIRASYGTTGNDQIPDYQYLSSYSSYSNTYQGLAGLYPSRISNPYYSWELVKKLEFGLDFSLLNDRISINSSYYRNRTNNQLVGYSLPSITGFSYVQANLPAVIQNTGFEISATSSNIRTKNFSWMTSVNLTIPKNKLVSYPNIEGSSYANQYVVGQSLFTRKLYQFSGVNDSSGIYQFETKGGSTYSPSYPDDLTTFKQVAPSFFGGLNNHFKYKNWQLDFLIQFVNQTGYNYFNTTLTVPGAFGQNPNQPTVVLNRWTSPGREAQVQRYSQDYGSPASTAYFNIASFGTNSITDASFIRLKNIELSFELPSPLIERLQLQKVQIYLQGQNLLTITHFKVFDPETNDIAPLLMLVAGINITL